MQPACGLWIGLPAGADVDMDPVAVAAAVHARACVSAGVFSSTKGRSSSLRSVSRREREREDSFHIKSKHK
jgi:hypothetical protein